MFAPSGMNAVMATGCTDECPAALVLRRRATLKRRGAASLARGLRPRRTGELVRRDVKALIIRGRHYFGLQRNVFRHRRATQCTHRCHHADTTLLKSRVVAACEQLALFDQING